MIPPVRAPAAAVIGFCGGIGSGKSLRSRHLAAIGTEGITPVTSAVADALKDLWLPQRHRIDCDLVAHRCYAKDNTDGVYSHVIRAFGQNVVSQSTGEIDRKALGRLVFDNPASLATLNELVWPAIATAVKSEIQQLDPSTIVLLEAAVLAEMTELAQLCDQIWLYHASQAVALERLAARDPDLCTAAALKRIQAQPSLQQNHQKLRNLLQTTPHRRRTDRQVICFDTSADSVAKGKADAEKALLQFLSTI